MVEAVYAATRKELASSGYSRFSLSVVAKRAGVDHATVYRRWPTKGALVLAAVGATISVEDPPRPGSLRGDLLFLTRRLAAWVDSPVGAAVSRALAAELDDPEVLALSRDARLKLHVPWGAAVQRAIARGEVPAKTDPSLVAEVITGAVLDVFVRATRALDDRFLVGVVDLVLEGALRGGALPRPKSRSRATGRPPRSASLRRRARE